MIYILPYDQTGRILGRYGMSDGQEINYENWLKIDDPSSGHPYELTHIVQMIPSPYLQEKTEIQMTANPLSFKSGAGSSLITLTGMVGPGRILIESVFYDVSDQSPTFTFTTNDKGVYNVRFASGPDLLQYCLTEILLTVT